MIVYVCVSVSLELNPARDSAQVQLGNEVGIGHCKNCLLVHDTLLLRVFAGLITAKELSHVMLTACKNHGLSTSQQCTALSQKCVLDHQKLFLKVVVF